jgi:pyruvate dehydrogenase E1 component
LHRGWSRALAGGGPCHAARLLSRLAPDAGLVTIMDGPPGALSWLGGVLGHRTAPLGVERFGQSGDIPDLYRTYRLDAESVVDAAARLLADRPGRGVPVTER